MKNLMLNYINRGETKNSRFLRLTTVSLSAVFASSIILYWIYYFLIIKMDSFTLHPKTMYEFVSNSFGYFAIFIYDNILKNYLFIALFFFIFMLYQCFMLYEKESIRKISNNTGSVGFVFNVFTIISMVFGIDAVVSGEYINSFYGFLTFIISAFVLYFWVIRISFFDINEIGDAIKYLKKVYIRETLSKVLLFSYSVSLIFVLYEPLIALASIIIVALSLANMGFILTDNSIVGFEKGRLNKLELRGFNIPKEDNDGNPFAYVYAFSLSECMERKNFIELIVSTENCYIDIRSFSKELEKVYTENNIDKEHLVFLCIKECSLKRNEDEEDEDSNFYIDLLIDIYDLDNKFLSDINVKADFKNTIEIK